MKRRAARREPDVETEIERCDLDQAYELERLEAAAAGRRPRPRAWVEADLFRKAFGQGRRVASDRVPLERGRLAAAPPPPALAARRLSLVERAERIALGLPPAQRGPILLALRCLAAPRATDRVRAWLAAFPGRKATHAEIARDCALERATVTRALARLGLRRRASTSPAAVRRSRPMGGGRR